MRVQGARYSRATIGPMEERAPSKRYRAAHAAAIPISRSYPNSFESLRSRGATYLLGPTRLASGHRRVRATMLPPFLSDARRVVASSSNNLSYRDLEAMLKERSAAPRHAKCSGTLCAQ